jgi:ribonuclease Z
MANAIGQDKAKPARLPLLVAGHRVNHIVNGKLHAARRQLRAEAAAAWLLRGQAATRDDGVSLGYFPCHPDTTTGWLESYFGTRKTPYRVIGPTGARQLIENLERAYALDIKIRVADEKLPLSGIATEVTEFDCDGTIYEGGGVKVIAFEVDHGDVIKPCYGYRFEYGGRVAVFSSDTRYNHNVIKYGAGADLLVHEVASARPELMKEAYIQRIIGHHTTPREAGLVFAQTKPKLAVYTHIALLGTERIPPPTIDDVVAETRTTYRGPLAFGEDLMAFEIGETVLVRRLHSLASIGNAGIA